jgi:molybdopterin molybdotransferase
MGIKPTNLGIVKDHPQSIRLAIEQLEEQADLILITGGVSEGDYDFVPLVLQEMGYRNCYHKVAIKPGKPLWFGTKQGKYCFGLPGNPVSTFVQFEYVIKPFIYKMMGHDLIVRSTSLPLAEDYSVKPSDRASIVPVKIKACSVYPLAYHGSGHITVVPSADGFITIPAKTKLIKKGEKVNVRFV